MRTLHEPSERITAEAESSGTTGTRTLLISETFPPRVGGTATWFHEVYRRYPRGEVAVLTDLQPGDENVAEPHGMSVHRVPMRMTDWGLRRPSSLAAYLRLVRVARRLAKMHRADVIHCGRVLPEGAVASLLQPVHRVPYCVFVHGEEIGTILTSRELTFLARRVFARARRIVANSANTRRLLKALGVAGTRITVVHPGVDIERFQPAGGMHGRRQWPEFSGQPLLLTVGRLQRRKGQDTAIAALARIAQSFPYVHLVLAGTGEDEARLRTLAGTLGIIRRVTFLGHVPDERLPELYRGCDLVLLPNREERHQDIEGFGIVLLEAAASGKPVVAGRSGGVEEAVLDGKTGLLVDATDPEAVAAATIGLLRDPIRADEMGRLGRARVVADFSWELVTTRIRAAGHPPW